MISSSSALASSNSSRATGWSRIAGYLPFSSQARKKNCQSIISRSVGQRPGCTARTPVKAGTGQVVEVDPLAVGAGLLQGQQRAALRGLVLLAQPLLLGRGWPASSSRGPVGVEQVGHHADHPGGVQHVHRGRPS